MISCSVAIDLELYVVYLVYNRPWRLSYVQLHIFRTTVPTELHIDFCTAPLGGHFPPWHDLAKTEEWPHHRLPALCADHCAPTDGRCRPIFRTQSLPARATFGEAHNILSPSILNQRWPGAACAAI